MNGSRAVREWSTQDSLDQAKAKAQKLLRGRPVVFFIWGVCCLYYWYASFCAGRAFFHLHELKAAALFGFCACLFYFGVFIFAAGLRWDAEAHEEALNDIQRHSVQLFLEQHEAYVFQQSIKDFDLRQVHPGGRPH